MDNSRPDGAGRRPDGPLSADFCDLARQPRFCPLV